MVSDWSNADTSYIEGGTESGLYLGITYFGSELSIYPAQLLTENSVNAFNAFIDSKNELDYETLLYYAVDKAMSRLKSNKFPDDLFSASIVTFTDGQDDGSVGWKEDETGKTYYKGDYEKELATILEESVQGIPVMSYSIGLKQNGVSSNTAFINSLKTIAHPATNYRLAADMAEVNETFGRIAQELSYTFRLKKLICTLPRQASGTKIRFTYDNIGEESASYSSLYIEGVYNSSDYSLRDVVYSGMTSTSGSTVVGVRNGNRVTFTFEGVHPSNDADISMNYYKRWTYDTSEWTEYIETVFQEGENKIGKDLKSAVIMLNLDCTQSLGENNFALLKNYAKNFVNTLYKSSIDPGAVQKITLDKSSVEMIIGESTKLIATISPSTAVEKGIIWSSSNPDVASVDANGNVQATAIGETTITATTKDGNKTASCVVNVFLSIPVTSVSIEPQTISIQSGTNVQLKSTVLPSNATNKQLEWTSSDESIATISQSGVICGLTYGKVLITAKSVDNSSCSASCEVTVTPSTSPSCLCLAVEENTGKKYYIPKNLYKAEDVSNFTKLGIVCGNAGSYFILKMQDGQKATYHSGSIGGGHGSSLGPGSISPGYYTYTYDVSGSDANSLETLPDNTMAKWLSENMTDVNTALTTFGGTAMLTSTNYWTREYRGNKYYYYFKKGMTPTYDSSGSMTCRFRGVKSL